MAKPVIVAYHELFADAVSQGYKHTHCFEIANEAFTRVYGLAPPYSSYGSFRTKLARFLKKGPQG